MKTTSVLRINKSSIVFLKDTNSVAGKDGVAYVKFQDKVTIFLKSCDLYWTLLPSAELIVAVTKYVGLTNTSDVTINRDAKLELSLEDGVVFTFENGDVKKFAVDSPDLLSVIKTL